MRPRPGLPSPPKHQHQHQLALSDARRPPTSMGPVARQHAISGRFRARCLPCWRRSVTRSAAPSHPPLLRRDARPPPEKGALRRQFHLNSRTSTSATVNAAVIGRRELSFQGCRTLPLQSLIVQLSPTKHCGACIRGWQGAAEVHGTARQLRRQAAKHADARPHRHSTACVLLIREVPTGQMA